MALFWHFFFDAFGLKEDGMLFMWLLLIVFLLTLFFKIRKNHNNSEKFAKLMWILGVWGTLYGAVITFAAVGSVGIPDVDRTRFLYNGIASDMIPIVFSVIGWFIIFVLDLFLPEEQ